MGGSNTRRRSLSAATVRFIKRFSWNDAVLAVSPGILETRVGCAGFATVVVGITGDAGVGGLMDDQPELVGQGFALRHNLISASASRGLRIKMAAYRGPDSELAQFVRRLSTKVAPVALPVLRGLIMATLEKKWPICLFPRQEGSQRHPEKSTAFFSVGCVSQR